MNWPDLLTHIRDYLALAACGLALGTAAGIALGVLAGKVPGARGTVLTLANVARAIPSLAILTFMLPILGVGFVPAIVALGILATPPIAINTDLGFRGVPAPLLDAAKGMGMSARQSFWLVECPLGFPIGFTGVPPAQPEVCASAVLLTELAAPAQQLWIGPLVLAAATLGFLVWNWPPAKIFMGDAGSGFLGLMLAAFSLQAGWVASRLFWSWVILLGVFVVDATVTLIRRTANGEKFYEAHRSHAYQHAARRCGGHLPATLAGGLINMIFLLPVALLVANGALDGFAGVLLTYVALAGRAWWIGAGTE